MTQGPTNDQSHSSYGITIKRDVEPKGKEDDGFESLSRPEVPVSQDAERLGHTKPPVVDHTPAEPALEQAQEEAQAKGNNKLAALLAKAGEAAKELAAKAFRKEIETERSGKNKKKISSVIEEAAVVPTCPVIWAQEDVVSDEEFIKRTIGSYDYNQHSSGFIHAEEIKRLFWANGGQRYLEAGLGYGAAFDQMRADKIRTVRIKNNPIPQMEDQKNTFPYDAKIYVAGLPTLDKFLAIEAAGHREADYLWMQGDQDEEKEEKQ
jgi:hypothetical protein